MKCFSTQNASIDIIHTSKDLITQNFCTKNVTTYDLQNTIKQY